MKKLIGILLTVLLIAGMSGISAFALTEVNYGNIDSDTEITAADARLILRKSVSLENLDIYALKAADLDFDGVISAADARLALRISVKLDTVKPVSDVKILLHGASYYVSCKMTNESGTTPFVSAKNGDSFIFSIPTDTYDISYIKNAGGRFISYNKTFAPLTDSAMKILGLNDEIAELDNALGFKNSIFANMLDGYEESKTIIEVDAKMIARNKTVIPGNAGSYTVVYETLDGQLMSIESFTSRGTSTNRFEFNITTAFIPDGIMDSSRLTQSDIFDFLIQLYNNKDIIGIFEKLIP